MALSFSQIHGQPGMMEKLSRSFQSGLVVHAYLLHGEDGCGKKTLAQTLSLALHCTGEGEKPCMVCGPCRRMLAGTHPDHIEIRPEGNVIRVEQVRRLLEALREKPYEGARRTVVIHCAEKMNEVAQNALLKTLEEPEGDTVFFLLTAHPEGLLPTVRSRCRALFLPRLDPEVIARDLEAEGISPSRARYAAVLSQGNPGRARELCDPENPYFARRDRVLALLRRLRSPEEVPRAAAEWKDKPDTAECLAFLDAMEGVLRDAMRIRAGLEPFDGQAAEETREIAGRFSLERIVSLLEEIVCVRKRLDAHVQWRSAWTPLLLKIVEE